jgi:hypothetical protein
MRRASEAALLRPRETSRDELRKTGGRACFGGVVAAGKALIDLERSDPRSHDSDVLLQGARDQLADNLMAMAARRQGALERGETRRLEICPACGQSTDLDSVMGRVVSALTMMSSRSSTAQPGPELSAARRPRRPGSGAVVGEPDGGHLELGGPGCERRPVTPEVAGSSPVAPVKTPEIGRLCCQHRRRIWADYTNGCSASQATSSCQAARAARASSGLSRRAPAPSSRDTARTRE